MRSCRWGHLGEARHPTGRDGFDVQRGGPPQAASPAAFPVGRVSETPSLPAPLADAIADLEFADRTLRAELLIEYADRFVDVPPEVARRPFPESARAPRCESEAFVFATDRPD